MRLGAFMRPISIHTAAWRYPGAFADANFNFAHLRRFAQTLERGRFDAFFMADHLAVLNMPTKALQRSATVTSFDPLTLLPALAAVTDHLGLIATASTSYNEPYHVARKFASLDHLSGGRAGWNVVTSANPHEAMNFGRDEHLEHDERYRRAREFFDVVTGLWDSFADDAFIRDVTSGIYFDPTRMHVLDHRGEFFSVRGPLNVARPVQGWPVIVQAGASETGRQFAAEIAEVVFSGISNLEDARRYYADVKGRAEALGRSRDHLKILPGAFVIVGDTLREAREKKARLDAWRNKKPIEVKNGTCTTTAKSIGDTHISEDGRKLLADNLQRLLDAEQQNKTITRVFAASRNAELDRPPAEWAAEFVRKAQMIIDARCTN